METASVAMTAEPFAVTLTQGFQDLYQRYAESVYRTALRVTGDPADAEDVLQKVFLRIFENRLVVDPERSPEGYLRRAATNASIDLLRRNAVLPRVEIEEGRDLSRSPEWRPSGPGATERAAAAGFGQDSGGGCGAIRPLLPGRLLLR